MVSINILPALPCFFSNPDFIKNVPSGHFLGIGSTRKDAFYDAIKQIFQKIGSEYQLQFNKSIKNNDNLIRSSINDSFSFNTGGILSDIGINDSYHNKSNHYVLVNFLNHQIYKARESIRKENNKRMAQFKAFINKDSKYQANGHLKEALKYFELAEKISQGLFIDKQYSKLIADTRIKDISDLIVQRKKREEELRKRKPRIKVSNLNLTDKCFVFEVSEVNGKNVTFDSYNIDINTKYKHAGLINYYFMKVDRQKSASRSFDLLKPIYIDANKSEIVMIPLNSWVKEKQHDLTSYFLGSETDYQITLHSSDLSVVIK